MFRDVVRCYLRREPGIREEVILLGELKSTVMRGLDINIRQLQEELQQMNIRLLHLRRQMKCRLNKLVKIISYGIEFAKNIFLKKLKILCTPIR